MKVYSSSFNRARSMMNKYSCCFITAWRAELSTNEKNKRNQQLASDIRSSGLTYYKSTGGYVENKGTDDEVRVVEKSFMVVNNRYTYENFVKLCVYWCGKYGQDSVLITQPSSDNNGAINVTGRYYNSSGGVELEFSGAEVKDVDEYFTNLYGKDFEMVSASVGCLTPKKDVRNATTRRLSDVEFRNLFPDL